MKNSVKKNLWWVISSIVLFVPIAWIIHSLQCDLGEKLSMDAIFFIPLFLIWAITGVVANKIKKVVLKVLWVILGLVTYVFGWLFVIVLLAMSTPVTQEEVECRKEGSREMICREFNEEDHLDKIVGIQLPQYRIVDSECTYVTFWPTETEYNVDLKIHFPKGLPNSVWKEIREKASNNASNPLAEEWAKNEWSVSEETPGVVSYRYEDFANVGCSVTFESNCDTVYVTRYKW